jgi:hypothetical protein
MPGSNGVYSLPPGYLAVTGATIEASQHNPPLEDIAAVLTLRLSRDGRSPMTGALRLASGAVGARRQARQLSAGVASRCARRVCVLRSQRRNPCAAVHDRERP